MGIQQNDRLVDVPALLLAHRLLTLPYLRLRKIEKLASARSRWS